VTEGDGETVKENKMTGMKEENEGKKVDKF